MTHFVDAKALIGSDNNINVYRGCQHGCIYCDARSACYQMNHRFEDIEVKQNAPTLLAEALRKRRKRCMIGTGAMSDPYMPLESELRLTRRCAEVAAEYGFGMTVLTKSSSILADLPLYQQIHKNGKCVLQMTLTTADEALCKIVEPKVCGTRERADALLTIHEAGIPTVVWLCPLLPHLNDTEENLRELLALCFRAGVKGVLYFGAGMTLRSGDREYYYKNLDARWPGLSERYRREYGDAYELVSPNAEKLDALFHALCEKHGVLHDNRAIFEYLRRFDDSEQLSLF